MEAIETIKSQSLSRPEGTAAPNLDRKTLSRQGGGTPEMPVGKGQQIEQEVRTKVERIAEAMDKYMKSNQTDLSIKVHKATGNIMVKVISQDDGKIIREIPPEKLLNLAAKMEQMIGILYDGNV
ncbi:MAG: flagellar protein FlaG [Deltaproteobacteria bacterium]|nr:flagellar protein FlaG [Deltaproteobacteria bacterium]